MRRGLRSIVALGLTVTVAMAATAAAKPTVITLGKLVLTVSARISPKALPAHRYAPVGFTISAGIRTKDGSHPPAATAFDGEFDRSTIVNAKGMPVCRRGQLEARTSEQALQQCRGALIGKGSAEAEVEFPEQRPFAAKGPLYAFNGGVRGNTTLILVHVYARVPAPTAFVTPVKLTKIHNGPYGLRITSDVPKIANGYGSVTHFDLTTRAKFMYRGTEQSYFLARCPSGRLLGRELVTFSDGTTLKGNLVVPCSQRK